MSENYQIKVIIVGATNVGKTCIVNRIIRNIYEPTSTTILQNIESTTLIRGNQSVPIQIFDIAGSEDYYNIVDHFFHYAQVALLVFSIDSKKSFEDVDKWLEKIKNFFVTEDIDDDKYISLILVGTKKDLSDKREVDANDAENKAKEIGPMVKYIEVSSLNEDGIDNLKDNIAELAILSSSKAHHKPEPKPVEPKCCSI